MMHGTTRYAPQRRVRKFVFSDVAELIILVSAPDSRALKSGEAFARSIHLGKIVGEPDFHPAYEPGIASCYRGKIEVGFICKRSGGGGGPFGLLHGWLYMLHCGISSICPMKNLSLLWCTVFGYLFVVCTGLTVVGGVTGWIASWWFVRKVYGATNSDQEFYYSEISHLVETGALECSISIWYAMRSFGASVGGYAPGQKSMTTRREKQGKRKKKTPYHGLYSEGRCIVV